MIAEGSSRRYKEEIGNGYSMVRLLIKKQRSRGACSLEAFRTAGMTLPVKVSFNSRQIRVEPMSSRGGSRPERWLASKRAFSRLGDPRTQELDVASGTSAGANGESCSGAISKSSSAAPYSPPRRWASPSKKDVKAVGDLVVMLATSTDEICPSLFHEQGKDLSREPVSEDRAAVRRSSCFDLSDPFSYQDLIDLCFQPHVGPMLHRRANDGVVHSDGPGHLQDQPPSCLGLDRIHLAR